MSSDKDKWSKTEKDRDVNSSSSDDEKEGNIK